MKLSAEASIELEMHVHIPHASMIMHSQREGLVRFIMMLLGISAATYHGKNTASATYRYGVNS